MAWFTLLLALGLLLASSSSAPAAQPEPFDVRSAVVDRNGELSAVVVVPPGPTPPSTDFELLIDTRPVTAARAVQEHQLNAMFLVDVSGSMKGKPLADVKAALSEFLKTTRPQDQFALTLFADTDRVISPSRDGINAALSHVQTQGKQTKLYQALFNALQRGQSDDPQTRRILVVLSDGRDEGSDVKLQQVIDQSRDKRVPIYAVFRGEIEGSFADVLSGLASAASGKFFSTHRSDEIASALKEIYARETSSVTVRFAYEGDRTGRLAQDAQITLRRPTGPALRAGLPKGINLPAVHVPVREPPPPTLTRPWWPILLLAVIVAGGALWLWRRRRRASPVPAPAPTVDREVEPTVDVPAPTPSRHRVTQIGQYFPAPASGQPAIILRGVSGPAEGQQHAMEREIFSIGADAQSDLPIAEDEYVSREHAYLRYERGSLFIFDKASRNGTFVNDNLVPQTGVALRPGDRITLGRSTFSVVMPPG